MSVTDQDLDDEPREECGVFGIWAPGEDVANLTYHALYALQHRGQEAAGIAVADGESITVYKDLGLISTVFNERTLSLMKGHTAIGHCRYSTTGGASWDNAQPVFCSITSMQTLAFAHNGNLVNTSELSEKLRTLKCRMQRASSSDSAIIASLLTHSLQQVSALSTTSRTPDMSVHEPVSTKDIFHAAAKTFEQLLGAFSLVFMTENSLFAARDPHGIRPLCIGEFAQGYVIASETSALDIIGARFVRDVEPGELVLIDDEGITSWTFAQKDPHFCLFEHIYLARPDSRLNGRLVHQTRLEIGKILARKYPVEADLVIGTPESGTPAAIGYAQESGINYGQGFMKNAYVGRTFIQPTQIIRQRGLRLKLNPLEDIIRGQKIVVVDDSIVRGNTQNHAIKMLRDAGAVEIHVRIASAPVRWPCFYGIDFASSDELIANKSHDGQTCVSDDLEEIIENVCKQIGADSLGYISVEDMVQASQSIQSQTCTACFTGRYPIAPPVQQKLGKSIIEISPIRK